MFYREMHSSVKGIVFDLDDTLYLQKSFKNSGFKVIAKWLEETYGLSSLSILKELDTILDVSGPSHPYIFDQLVAKIQLPHTIVPNLVLTFINHNPKIDLFHGVTELLEALKNEFKLGILTDGRESVQRRKVTALGLHNIIDTILYSDSLGLQKPAIELFEYFEDKFQLPGKNLLYVGDNPQKDFIGAKKRNWNTCRVLTGEYANLSLGIDTEAHYQLKNVSDLYRLPLLAFNNTD